MSERPPYIVVVGGPNGAGKSTIARAVLSESFGISEFVNADTIAAGLAAFNPESAAFAAGRVMLSRLDELAAARATFAFESTLSSRTFSAWLARQIASGYEVHIVYVALNNSSLAVKRVKRRVREGGHSIPVETIRRRFVRSAHNLRTLYLPLATTWRIYNNSGVLPTLAATGSHNTPPHVLDSNLWRTLHEASQQVAQIKPTSRDDDADREGH